MCYNQTGDISTLEGTPLKLVDKFTYLGSSVESTEKDIETRLTKAWTAINRLSTIWKSDLTDKMKRSFFQAAVIDTAIWMHYGRFEKKLDGIHKNNPHPGSGTPQDTNCTATCPITKSILGDIYICILFPTHGRAKAGRPARTYIQQLCEDKN